MQMIRHAFYNVKNAALEFALTIGKWDEDENEEFTWEQSIRYIYLFVCFYVSASPEDTARQDPGASLLLNL